MNMCGRFTLTVDISELAAAFGAQVKNYRHAPRYNIAPGQDIPVVTQGPGGRVIIPMRWGFIPPWTGDERTSYKMINARAETVAGKPAYRQSFRHRRCLVPADGFYEWKKEGRTKRPLRIILPGEKLFAFPGLWSAWRPAGGGVVHTCCIITTAANEYLEAVHHRMPVIFTEEQEYALWLSSDDTSLLQALLRPYGGEMVAYPVSSRVNAPENDDPRLIERARDRLFADNDLVD